MTGVRDAQTHNPKTGIAQLLFDKTFFPNTSPIILLFIIIKQVTLLLPFQYEIALQFMFMTEVKKKSENLFAPK